MIKFLQSIFHNNMRSTEFNPYVTLNGDILKKVSAIMTENEKYDERTSMAFLDRHKPLTFFILNQNQ